MQRIGRALHISSNKNIILKAEKSPKFGDKIVDKNFESVGIVFDIFGPTSAPYISVKTAAKEPHRFIGQVLYAVPSKPQIEKRRRRK